MSHLSMSSISSGSSARIAPAVFLRERRPRQVVREGRQLRLVVGPVIPWLLAEAVTLARELREQRYQLQCGGLATSRCSRRRCELSFSHLTASPPAPIPTPAIKPAGNSASAVDSHCSTASIVTSDPTTLRWSAVSMSASLWLGEGTGCGAAAMVHRAGDAASGE